MARPPIGLLPLAGEFRLVEEVDEVVTISSRRSTEEGILVLRVKKLAKNGTVPGKAKDQRIEIGMSPEQLAILIEKLGWTVRGYVTG
jgi:hypothetical protein